MSSTVLKKPTRITKQPATLEGFQVHLSRMPNKSNSKGKNKNSQEEETDAGNGAQSKPAQLNQVLNYDHCVSCGDGGKLLCCDRCPRSFHFDCVNPPINPNDSEIMKSDWFCNKCKFDMDPSPSTHDSTILSSLFTQLEATNPEAFVLPHDLVWTENQSIPDNKVAEGDSKRKKVTPQKMPKEESCFLCGNDGEMVTCFLCNKSFHLYCLEPPLLYRPLVPWSCSEHEISKRRKNHLLPEKTFKLPFPSKRESITSSEYEETIWLLNLSRPQTREQPELSEETRKMLELQEKQQNSILKALTGNSSETHDLDSNSSETPKSLQQITPLFTQFLAWQRLLQINQNVNNLYIQQIQQSSSKMTQSSIPPPPIPPPPIPQQQPTPVTPPLVPTPPPSEPLPISTTPTFNLNDSILTGSRELRIIQSRPNEARRSYRTRRPAKRRISPTPEFEEPEKLKKQQLKPIQKENPLINEPKKPISKSKIVEPPPNNPTKGPVVEKIEPKHQPSPSEKIKEKTLIPRAKQRPVAFLEDENGVKVFEIKRDYILLGRKHREHEVDLDLTTIVTSEQKIKTISRSHASISYNPSTGTFSLKNLGRNGTKVGGALLQTQMQKRLTNGDELEFGKFKLIFREMPPSSAPPANPM